MSSPDAPSTMRDGCRPTCPLPPGCCWSRPTVRCSCTATAAPTNRSTGWPRPARWPSRSPMRPSGRRGSSRSGPCGIPSLATPSMSGSTRYCTTPRTSSEPTPGDQGGRGVAPAGLARRAHPHAGGGMVAGAPRAHDGDRPRRHPGPRRQSAACGDRDQARGEIDGVEQLTRYLELLNRDPLLAPVAGIFAAQEIKPQARTLAQDRGIRCVVLDYEALRGIDDTESRLF